MQKNSGFTLVEVAIALVIGGIILATSSALLLNQIKKSELQTTESRLVAIDEALQLYLNLNGRYPCPALLNDALDSATFGVESPVGGVACAGAGTFNGRDARPAIFGAIPVRTLNLPDSYIADAWGGRYTYTVTKALAENNTYNREEGALSIVDSAGNFVVLPDGTAHYTVVSHGRNNSGATSLDGQLIQACDVAAQDGQNCDFADSTFRSSLMRSGAQGANFNDDIMHFKAMTSFGAEIPPGAVMPFNLGACPQGWVAFASAGGRFLVGADATYALAAEGGDDDHTLTTGEIGFEPSAQAIDLTALPPGPTYVGVALSTSATAHNNMPPYVSLLYCEKS